MKSETLLSLLQAVLYRSLLLAAATWVVAVAQFVPGFLVESGTDLQEWPKNLSSLFPENTSPEEQQVNFVNSHFQERG